MKTTDDDKILEQGLKNGSREAIQTIYREVGPGILAYVLKNSGNKADAEDVINIALLRVIESIRKGNYKHQNRLRPYTYTVAANVWKEQLRIRKRLSLQSLDEEQSKEIADDSEEEIYWKVVKEEQLTALHQALEKIREECRTAIRLYYFKHVPLKEIAVQMGTNYNNMKQRFRECKKGLRRETERILNKNRDNV